MTHRITTTRHFAAAHRIRLYDGSWESMHGHNWGVKVTLQSPRLDAIGVVMDFHELEAKLDQILAPLHNHCVNEVAPFDQINPTAERIAEHIAGQLQLPKGIELLSVEVWETPENSAICLP